MFVYPVDHKIQQLRSIVAIGVKGQMRNTVVQVGTPVQPQRETLGGWATIELRE